MASMFDLVSFNARGLGCDKKRKKVFTMLKKQTSTNVVLFIQEGHGKRDVEKLWQKQWNEKIFYSHGTTSSRGVFIALRKNLEFKLLSPEICDPQGRYIILNIEIMGSPFMFINYYVPNNQSDQLKILKEIQAKLKNIQIIDGTSYTWGRSEWNCIFDESLDSMGGKIKLDKDTIKEIEKLKSDSHLLDIWRVRNPSFCKFSWRRTKPATLRRLDCFLISSELEQNILSCGFLSPIQSDHSPIYLKIKPLNDINRRPGYWKFNKSLIEDASYVSRMKDFIVSRFSENNDPRINWEFLKYKIKQFTQTYSKEKARERKAKQKQLAN